MKSDFLVAVTQLAAERNLPRDIVLSAIEAALVSAYRKDGIAEGQDVSVKLDPGTGEVTVYIIKTVVEEVTAPAQEITLEEARKIDPNAEMGGTVSTGSIPHTAGRIAAQTAKQVVMQRLREAERELVYQEFADKEGEVFPVTIQRIEPRQIIVDLGRAEAILPASEQALPERYRPGQKLKMLLQRVDKSVKGPELIVSRADKLLVKRLFEMEVPEVYNGVVEIVAIAREAGARSKVAVKAKQDGVDPVGSCVGLRGVRIQNIVNELQGEKIDVVEWNKEPTKFIANALSPAQVMRVDLDLDTQSAAAIVPDRHLSLAIGREGQNARLAAKLTGWSIDIRSTVGAETAPPPPVVITVESGLDVLGLSTRTLNVLQAAGIQKVGDLVSMSKPEMLEIKSFGQASYTDVQGRLTKLVLPAATPVAAPVEVEAKPVAVEPAPVAVVEAVAEAPVEVVQDVTAEGPEAPAAEAEAEVASETKAAEGEVEEAVVEEAAVEEVAAEPTQEAPIAAPSLVEELEPVAEPAMAALDRSASLRDVPEDVWSLRRGGAGPQPGVIRFAEDIAGLKGGVTARRGPRRDDTKKPQSRKKRKPGKRR